MFLQTMPPSVHLVISYAWVPSSSRGLLACRAYHWPDFRIWAELYKLDLQAEELGGGNAAERLNLAGMAHIPVVRLRCTSTMYLSVPKQSKWEHLWLECSSIMDLDFEDVTTFGKVRTMFPGRSCLGSSMRTHVQRSHRACGTFMGASCLQGLRVLSAHLG